MGNAIKLLGLITYLQLIACDLGYYAHLAQGQARIIWQTQQTTDFRKRESTPDSVKKQFILVDSILHFAHSIGLNSKGQYTKFYDTGGDPISWNVSAAPQNSLTPYIWHFPLVGGVPYKGFFNRSRAEREYNRLISEGYDVLLRPVSAYSTLGYLSDPLLSTMLSYPPHVLTDLILHELTHATMYAKGHADFNESVATFIGQEGARQFLRKFFGKENEHLQKLEEERQDRHRFRLFIHELTQDLDSLYQASPEDTDLFDKRERVFARAQERFEKTLPLYTNQGYRAFLQWEINNARLLSYRRYNSKQDVFQRILTQFEGDLNQSIAHFSQCSNTDYPWKCLESQKQ